MKISPGPGTANPNPIFRLESVIDKGKHAMVFRDAAISFKPVAE
jgi:hypothetical protein